MPRSRIRIVQAVVGGMIAGCGARLAMGCNGRLLPGSRSFSLHAWFFAGDLRFIVWFGAALRCCRYFAAVKMQKVSGFAADAKPDRAERRRFRASVCWSLSA